MHTIFVLSCICGSYESEVRDLIKHPKAMQAMLKMKKLDIAELERAARS
jgi:hypothetical protein